MIVDSEAVRSTMRYWATGVTIVTAKHHDHYHGMTVSSFTSISLEPPLVLVSLEKTTRTHELVQKAGVFGVTILAEEQIEISNRFANPHTETGYRFGDIVTHTLETGVPFISDGLAFLDCRVVSSLSEGTHTMFVGEVVALGTGKIRNPLLYYNRGYRLLSESS